LAVTPRTAGFASIDYGSIGNPSAYFTILLMVVGGSPGSTAGGIKTTAFAVLLALAFARLTGRRAVEIRHRSIPEETVERTVSLALVAFTVMTIGIFWLNFLETRGMPIDEARSAFLPIFFEVVSAFCTVGLSMDQTPALSDLGKLSVAALMFVGRVGPLSIFAALSMRSRGGLRDVRSAREDLIIG
jgi:trk system potassium uptake protein TrkH